MQAGERVGSHLIMAAAIMPSGGMKVKYGDIEEELYHWLLEQRDSGHHMSGKQLNREVHSEKGDQSCKACDGWLKCWRRRHHVSFRRKTTTVAQHLPQDLEEKVVDFHCQVTRLQRCYI